MTSSDFSTGGRAASLRRAFDESFASPASVAVADTKDLLAIRIAGDPYVLALNELSGVTTDKKVFAVPSDRSDLVGVVGIRGGVVPVYSLAVVLGYGPSDGSARWLALCGTVEPVAFAFDALEGLVRVAREDVVGAGTESAATPHVAELVRVGAVKRRVVDLGSVLRALKAHAGDAGSAKGK